MILSRGSTPNGTGHSTAKRTEVRKVGDAKFGLKSDTEFVNESLWAFEEADTTTMTLICRDGSTNVQAHLMHDPYPLKTGINTDLVSTGDIDESIQKRSGQAVSRAENLRSLKESEAEKLFLHKPHDAVKTGNPVILKRISLVGFVTVRRGRSSLGNEMESSATSCTRGEQEKAIRCAIDEELYSDD